MTTVSGWSSAVSSWPWDDRQREDLEDFRIDPGEALADRAAVSGVGGLQEGRERPASAGRRRDRAGELLLQLLLAGLA